MLRTAIVNGRRTSDGLITPSSPKWCRIAASFDDWRKPMLWKHNPGRRYFRKSALESTFLSNRFPATILYHWSILEQTDAA